MPTLERTVSTPTRVRPFPQSAVAVASRLRAAARLPLAGPVTALLTTTALTSGTGFLYWMLAARLYSAADVGRASAIVAALSVIGLLSGQGLAVTLLARLPRLALINRDSVLVTAVTTASGVAGLLAAAALIILPRVSPALASLRLPPVAAAFLIGAIAQGVGVVLDAAGIAARRSKVTTARNTIFGVGKLALLLVAALPWLEISPLPALVFSWAFTGLVSVAWATRTLREQVGTRNPLPFAQFAQAAVLLRRGAMAQNIAALGGALPQYILPVVVATRLDARHAAFFSITWMLAGVCFAISPAVSGALTAEGAHQPAQLIARIRTGALLTSCLLPIPVGVLLFGGPAVLAFFGPDYADAGSFLVMLLAVAAIPCAVTDLAVSVLRIRERLREIAVINAGRAVVSVTLAWLLLPRLGVAGAGWAWLIAQGMFAATVGAAGLPIFTHRRSSRDVRATPLHQGEPVGAKEPSACASSM